MTPDGDSSLSADERRLLSEAVARGLVAREAVEGLIARRELQEDGSLQPISQVLLLERVIAVPDFLALKRALAENDPPRAPPRPAAFGPYRVVRELARSPFTAVFECEDPLGGRFAVKALLSLTDAAASRRVRIEAELRGLLRLQHPGIVRIQGASYESGLPYFVMDLARGATLEQLLVEGELDPLDAAALVARVADAVGHAHGRGVLHRDLRPANIIVDGSPREGRVVLVGFSVARVLGFEVRVTRPGELVGTPSYAAPELVRSELGAPGPPADIYSLGVVLFEAIAGRLPFEAASVGELLVKILDEPPPSLRALRPAVPAAIASIVERALAKRPDARIADAAHLAALLREAAPDAPPERLLVPERAGGPRAVPARPPGRKSSRLSTGLLASGVVLVALLPLAAAWIGLELARDRATAQGRAIEAGAAARLARAASFEAARSEADRNLAAGDMEGALAALTSACNLRPERPETRAARARVEGRLGLSREAIDDATAVLALADRPSAPSTDFASEVRREALLARATAAFDDGDVKAALADIERLLAILTSPGSGRGEALTLRARVRTAIGEVDAARRDLEAAVGAPGQSLALGLAAVRAREGDLEGALGVLSVALDLEPGDLPLRAARGAALLAVGRVLEAVHEVGPLARATPRHGGYALLHARALAAAELWAQAIAELARANALSRRDAALERRLAAVSGAVPPAGADEVAARADYLLDKGEVAAASQILEAELAREPSILLERVFLRALVAQEDPRAVPLAIKLEDAPGPAVFLGTLATALLASGRVLEAERVASRAIAEGDLEPRIFSARGAARLEEADLGRGRGTFDEALADLARATRAEGPAGAEAWHSLALTLLRLSRVTEARAALSMARSSGCKHEDFLRALADLVGRATPPARRALSATEVLRVEALEIGDDEGWESASGRELAIPAFGPGHIFGRSGLLVYGNGAGRVAFPSASWRARAEALRPGSPHAATLDLRRARGLAATVAARGPDLAVDVLLRDAAGARLALTRKKASVKGDGTWQDVQVPFAGGADFELSKEGPAPFDLEHVVGIEVRLRSGGAAPFVAWLDGVRAD